MLMLTPCGETPASISICVCVDVILRYLCVCVFVPMCLLCVIVCAVCVHVCVCAHAGVGR